MLPCSYFWKRNRITMVFPAIILLYRMIRWYFISETGVNIFRLPLCLCYTTMSDSWAPSQYPKRRISVRSRKVSKPRNLYLELSDRSEIWQALRQQCCRCACPISKQYGNLKYQSRGFETLRDLTERRLFGYWGGALVRTNDMVMMFTKSADIYHQFSMVKWVCSKWK